MPVHQQKNYSEQHQNHKGTRQFLSNDGLVWLKLRALMHALYFKDRTKILRDMGRAGLVGLCFLPPANFS